MVLADVGVFRLTKEQQYRGHPVKNNANRATRFRADHARKNVKVRLLLGILLAGKRFLRAVYYRLAERRLGE